MRNAATDVTEVVIPNSRHWLIEEALYGISGAELTAKQFS